MAAYIPRLDKMITCPYDPAHKMLRSRLQHHLAKCKQNHMDSKLTTCPFDATHKIKESEFRDHLMKCSNRGVIDKKMMENIDNSNEFKGRTAVPAYNANRAAQQVASETWDNEIGAIGEAGFTPRDPATLSGITLDLMMTKRAARKQVYLRSNVQEDEKVTNHVKPVNVRPAPQEPVRQPRESREMLLQGRNASIGRGTPLTSPAPNGPAFARTSRVAADIFPTERQPRASYQEVMSLNAVNGLAGIGRGRGRIAYEKEFPSLGQR